MTTIAQLATTLQEVFTSVADRIARETQFVQRTSPITGSVFARALVSAWLADPQATDEQLAQAMAAAGVNVTPQAVTARFNRPAAELMQGLLEAAVGHIVAAAPAAVPILQRFHGVYIQDSTTITLPDELVDIWHGSGENPETPTVAGLKVQVQWDYSTGRLSQVLLEDGSAQDGASPVQTAPLPAGALRLADQGYFRLPVLAKLSAERVYWLSRVPVSTGVWTAEGAYTSLVALLQHCPEAKIECQVLLGKEQRLPCRLLAVRVPQEVADRRRQNLLREARRKGRPVSQDRLLLAGWTILVTNIPPQLLSIEEALVVMGCRWQIELLFKLWKSHGQVDESQSQNPWHILTEIYAKLLAMVVEHWLFLVSFWTYPNRSLVKAAQTVRRYAMLLAVDLDSRASLCRAITTITRCLQAGCRINTSRVAPHTYQQLAALPASLDAPSVEEPQLSLLSSLDIAIA